METIFNCGDYVVIDRAAINKRYPLEAPRVKLNLARIECISDSDGEPKIRYGVKFFHLYSRSTPTGWFYFAGDELTILTSERFKVLREEFQGYMTAGDIMDVRDWLDGLYLGRVGSELFFNENAFGGIPITRTNVPQWYEAFGIHCDLKPLVSPSTDSVSFEHPKMGPPAIKKVIFNNPATIVFWEDGTKTVVKCQDEDIFSETAGLHAAFCKKILGNQGNFNDYFKKWETNGGKTNEG